MSTLAPQGEAEVLRRQPGPVAPPRGVLPRAAVVEGGAPFAIDTGGGRGAGGATGTPSFSSAGTNDKATSFTIGTAGPTAGAGGVAPAAPFSLGPNFHHFGRPPSSATAPGPGLSPMNMSVESLGDVGDGKGNDGISAAERVIREAEARAGAAAVRANIDPSIRASFSVDLASKSGGVVGGSAAGAGSPTSRSRRGSSAARKAGASRSGRTASSSGHGDSTFGTGDSGVGGATLFSTAGNAAWTSAAPDPAAPVVPEAQQNLVDSMRSKAVAALRDEGRSLYTTGRYRDSILRYGHAIRAHNPGSTSIIQQGHAELLAVLYSNRAAALVMVGAYDAAVLDCRRALGKVAAISEGGDYVRGLRPEGGPALRSKVLCRMGRALLKGGDVEEAEQAFDAAAQTAGMALERSSADTMDKPVAQKQAERVLQQALSDAAINRSDVKRSRDATAAILACCREQSTGVGGNSLKVLMHVDAALALSPGDIKLNQQKANLLASMRRWADLAGHCERLAADLVRFDGVFVEDLADANPFPGVLPAKYLNHSFFQSAKEEKQNLTDVTPKVLDTKSVGEAVLRLQPSILPQYIRALRIEERYGEASRALSVLEIKVEGLKSTAEKRAFAWLGGEKEKLRRTMSIKERGDEMFRSGDYVSAAAKYAQCVLIDSGTDPMSTVREEDGENAGGRLHAVLHCNRAACFMALKQHRDALKECTAALRIHPTYMKAMLRRARCYARLGRNEEALYEYQVWVRLVEGAKTSRPDAARAGLSDTGRSSGSSCYFDRATDVTTEDLEKVRRELVEVRKARLDAKKAEEESKARTQRQHFYDRYNAENQRENYRKYKTDSHFGFGGGAGAGAGSGAGPGAGPGPDPGPDPGPGAGGNNQNAHTRRQKWYDQADPTSRRWDSFRGTSPKKPSAGDSQKQQQQQSPHGAYGGGRGQHNRSQRGRARTPPRKTPQGSPGSDLSRSHYEVLQVQSTASVADIKKGYRKNVIKYHPDKNQDANAADVFRRIQMAYEVLSNDTSRRKYDIELRARQYSAF